MNEQDQLTNQLKEALEFIAHYYNHHSEDIVLRFRGEDGTHILITGVDEWKQKFDDLIKPIMIPDASEKV